jgi:hypothetical protein
MKTLNEVKSHVDVVGYNQFAINKIEGFLLGSGLLGGDFEMEYMIGDHDFDDFIKWFNSDSSKIQSFDDDFAKGDFVHLSNGVNILLLSDIEEDSCVGTDGEKIKKYTLLNGTRPCYEDEIASVEAKLMANGIRFSYDCDDVKPMVNRINTTDSDIIDKILSDIEDTAKEIKSRAIDILNVDCVEAIENIISSIHEGKLDSDEEEALVRSLHALVELGKMYE